MSNKTLRNALWFLALLGITLSTSSSFAGTVTGVITTATSGPIPNATLTLTLTQGATLGGVATIATTPVACYTDASGNVVGEPNGTGSNVNGGAPPVVSVNLASGTLAAGTYFSKTTYYDASGESAVSPEQTTVLSGPGTLIFAVPVKQPSTATGWKIYIGATSGSETLQSTQVGFAGSYSQTAALAAGAAMPASNTTACKLLFNDQLTPTSTGYYANLVNSAGSPISGFPQKWRLTGGANGTVNLSIGTPLYSGFVQYPDVIQTTPAAQGRQSVNGALDYGVAGQTSTNAGNQAVTGNSTVGGTLGVTGAINSIQQVSLSGDVCTNIIAAMNSCSSNGCEIRLPAGSGTCTAQLVVPNDGATMPLQKSFKIVGAGAGTNSAAGAASLAPNGGTIIDMQFSATTGKIDTRGAGYLEITGISFKDTTSDCTPFLFDTNTVLHLHDVAFYGSASGTSACNDAIILGGTTHTFCGTAVCAFQGYGTVIENNLFHRVRRAIKFDTDANNVQVVNNTVWVDSGSSTGGAFEIAPTASTSVGNYFAGNLIEVTNYKYGFWLKTNSFVNSFISNGCWDSTATTTACIHTDSGATNNIVIEGFADDTKPGLEDANTVRRNTIISSHARTAGAGLGSFLNQPFAIVDSSAGPGVLVSTGGPGIPEYAISRSDNSDQMAQELQCLTIHSWGLFWSPLGGTAENVLCMEYLGVQQYTLALPGTSFNSFDAPNGDVKLRSKAGNTVFIGDPTNNGIQVTNGIATFNKTVGSYNGVSTVSNGIPAEVATADLTAQTAAITTTTLYAVPAAGAGQYRISWDSKVTTAAGVSSTLGPMTVIWTDPDGVTITTVVPAMIIAGSLTTAGATTNTTSTFLTGMPFLINAKASTNIQFSFAYASNAAAAMNYNLHIKLEQM